MAAVPPPDGAGVHGAALWAEVTEAYVLEQHELALLREAVRTIDMLDQLHEIVERDGPVVDGGKAGPKAHPAMVEARQLKIALARLVAALRLPDGEDGDGTQGRRQRRVGVRGSYRMRAVS